MSYVYFFVCHAPHNRLNCKIGFSKSHPERRRREVQRMCPEELELFAYIEGDEELERKLHRTFDPVLFHHEWFSMENKLKDFVWYLVPDGPCEAPTPAEKFWNAVHDCILATCAPHPSIGDEEYTYSADMSEWEQYRAWLTGEDAGTA